MKKTLLMPSPRFNWGLALFGTIWTFTTTYGGVHDHGGSEGHAVLTAIFAVGYYFVLALFPFAIAFALRKENRYTLLNVSLVWLCFPLGMVWTIAATIWALFGRREAEA